MSCSWYRGEPNNSFWWWNQEDCAAYDHNDLYVWNDEECDNKYRYDDEVLQVITITGTNRHFIF